MEATKSIRSDGNCLSGPDTHPPPPASPFDRRTVSARRIPDVKKKEGPLFLPANKRGTRNNERETSGGIDKLVEINGINSRGEGLCFFLAKKKGKGASGSDEECTLARRDRFVTIKIRGSWLVLSFLARKV